MIVTYQAKKYAVTNVCGCCTQ